MRSRSFWTSSLSFLDRVLFSLRIKKLKWVDFLNKKIVDFWSWFNADFLQFIASQNKWAELFAYDMKLNKEMLEKIDIKTIEWNLNEPINIDFWIDIASSTAVLEHLENPELFLSEVYSKLNNGWILILTVPSVWSKPVLEFLAYKLKIIDRFEIEDHKRYYDKKSLFEVLTKAWFKREDIKHEYFEIYMNNFVIAIKND